MATLPSIGDVYEHKRERNKQVEVIAVSPALLEPDIEVRNTATGKRERLSLVNLSTRWRCVQTVTPAAS